jgi:hypothetical protein
VVVVKLEAAFSATVTARIGWMLMLFIGSSGGMIDDQRC